MCKKKRKGKHLAKDLYVSPLFKKSYEYLKKNTDKLFILSAKYGLIEESEIVEDYEMTLKTFSTEEKKLWTYKVIKKLLPNKENKYIIIAGSSYYQFLANYLKGNDIEYEILLEGLSMGNRLKKLNSLNK